MHHRYASIDDLGISDFKRFYHWPWDDDPRTILD
jgi:nuclear transport factor 2 (NTF2) superfamily protein